jgi:formylglycine-generating enzyme required for sulfatase activity
MGDVGRQTVELEIEDQREGVSRKVTRTLAVEEPRIIGPVEGQDWTVPELGLKMKWIAPGEFTMGSPASESLRDDDETQHLVKLTKGYWLGAFEVTQAEWKAIMRTEPSFFKGSDRLPVESVSWGECMEFCRKLTAREKAAKRLPEGMEYTLPTEAQWEYACRAGTTGMSWKGDFRILGYRNAPELGRIAWYGGNSQFKFLKGIDSSEWPEKEVDHKRAGTQIVGGKGANPWGLHDMLGNVWEWCSDWYGAYPSGSVTDPGGPSEGSNRVLRGGGWDDDARDCRSANRTGRAPTNRYDGFGFRLSLQAGD